MAAQLDWERLLKERFPIFKVEEQAYIESLDIATSTEVYIERIYFAIRTDVNVPENLKALYEEASRGGDKDVVKRIKNRIGNIRRNCRFVLLFLLCFNILCLLLKVRCGSREVGGGGGKGPMAPLPLLKPAIPNSAATFTLLHLLLLGQCCKVSYFFMFSF